MAFFAIYGVITTFFKDSNLNIFRSNPFIQAFCLAALLAFIPEITFFNQGYYLKYFADGETHVLEVSPQDSTILLTSDGTLAEQIYLDKDDSTKVLAGMVFKNLNRRVTSLYIKPIFDNEEQIWARIIRTDEAGSAGGVMFFFKNLPQDNYIPIHSCGPISEIKIFLDSKISEVAINKQIPLHFSGLRLFVVSCLFFAVILFLRKKLRVQVAHLLFEHRFDPANKTQKLIYTLTVLAVLIFSFICAFTSDTKFWREDYLTNQQYNRFLVDAVIGGRTYLDHGNPELLLIAERPYDLKWLKSNGFKRDVVWMSDWAWYKGKYYSYFGIVPAIILYVPYKLITGEYLSNKAGIFLFIALSIILMAMLWRHCVRRYMPNMNFTFYLLSFLTLFFAGGLFTPLRFTRFYSIVLAAGFMFVVAGILLLLKSVDREKPDFLKVFFSCLCFALAVGCRPNLAFVSLLVPVILWRYKSLKLAMIILAPYIIVAIPLCWYNYIRFDSIFDFGIKYNMTTLNIGAHSLLNPLGKFLSVFYVFTSYLFTFNYYSIFFPFTETLPGYFKGTLSIPVFYDKGCGMINFPIVLCLFILAKNMFTKNKPQILRLSSLFLIAGVIQIFLNSYIIGFSGRYITDFAFLIILPSIFCAWYWCFSGQTETCSYINKSRLKITYTLLCISILVGLFLFAGQISNDPSPGNPTLYRYLQTSLSLF